MQSVHLSLGMPLFLSLGLHLGLGVMAFPFQFQTRSLIPITLRGNSSSVSQGSGKLESSSKSLGSPTSSQGGSDLSPSYLSRLWSEIQSRIDFPQDFQNKKMKGSLSLAVTFSSEGRIQKIEVLKSTGFLDLDRHAMGRLQQAPYTPFPHTLAHLDSLRLEIPIEFRLD